MPTVWPVDEPEEGEDPVPEPPALEVEVTDNPVIYELLGPDGEVIRQWLARTPIGFALPEHR
jgi:hypothetical protein